MSFSATFCVRNLIKNEKRWGCGFYTVTIDLNKNQSTICFRFLLAFLEGTFFTIKKTNLKISRNICVIGLCL